jgi:hypothetical protein
MTNQNTPRKVIFSFKDNKIIKETTRHTPPSKIGPTNLVK